MEGVCFSVVPVDGVGMEDFTAEQMEALHERLLSVKAELEAQLSDNRADSKPVDLDLPIGRISRIDAIQQQKMAQAQRRGQEVRLGQLKVALQNFGQDEYGYCRSCEEAISFERLLARPESPFCVDCKNQIESRRR